jgi:cell division protein FtsQ
MSSAYALREKNAGEGGSVSGRAFKAAVALAVAAIALFLAVRFIALPLTTIRRVIVESDLPLSEQEILAQTGLSGAEHFLSLDTAPIARRLEANPLVRKARVQKVFPDTIRLVLHRREAAAVVLAQAGGRNVPVLVDRDGYVFKVGDASDDMDLAEVSGLSVGEVALGSALPQEYRRVFADLAALKAGSPSLYRLISEVRVVSSGSGSVASPAAVDAGPRDPRATSSAAGQCELLLYLLSSPVRIRARGGVDENLLKYSLVVLDLLSNQGVLRDIVELDFRGADVVYRTKEG